MKRYLFIWCLFCSVCFGAEHRPPNIIFIMADDLGWGDLGCYGQKLIQTPQIDRMASEGIRFTQVYAGSTVCAPSRCVLMTGQHTGHCRVRGNARVPLLPEDRTVAEILGDRGYQTFLVGKWGLGDAGTTGMPTRQGFDYFFGYLNQRHAHNYYPTFLWRNETKVPLKNVVPKEDAEGAGVASVKAEYSHDLFAADSLRVIREAARDRSKPFFLYFALTIPHANNEAKKQGMEVPDLEPYQDLNWPAPQKAHAAMITRMDNDIGRLLALLKTLGLDQETIVFFTSDNGPHREGGNDPEFNHSSGPLRGIKRDMHEGGIRVPMIVRWPGHVPEGKTSDQVWYFADFLPTAAALAGAKPPKQIDGVNVLPTLLGKRQNLRDRFLYWEFYEGGFKQAARHGRWKAVRRAPSKPVEIYDLESDLHEDRDLAAAKPKVLKEMEQFLKTAHVDSPDWKITEPKAKASPP